MKALACLLVFALVGCKPGGKEGDRCNPLVLRDECDDGLHCRAATCSESYCCPIRGSSGDPNCSAPGCPDADAAVDAPVDAATSD